MVAAGTRVACHHHRLPSPRDLCHFVSIDTSLTPLDNTPRRSIIEHSWRRSALSGVHPDDAPPTNLADIGSADPLLDAARPVLDDAAIRLADTDMSLLLVDNDCRLVSRVACGAAVERTLDHLGAAPGVAFGEDIVGTTALGTPAEIRGSVAVNGAEHYLEQFKSVSCFGQPIIHPATRRLAGILCMTEIAERINPLAVPFVTEIVSDIADRLLDRSRAHQRRVLDAFQRAAPRRDIAVAAIGDDLQLTNSFAAQLLSPTDVGALRMVAADPGLRETVVPLTLVSGVDVELAVEPVPGVRGAALFRFRPAIEQPASAPAAAPTPAAARSVAITGEPGTGRSTHARSAAADRGDGEPVVVDVADELIAGTPPDIPGLVARARRDRVPLIIDGAELLDDRSVALLGRAVTQTVDGAPVIIVAGPRDQSGAGVAALLARCTTRIDLPPLRHRTSELAAIASTALRAIDPTLTLSGEATDALLCQDWPGNLSELDSVLHQAVSSCSARAARVVEPRDLPADYRTTSRAAHLSGREQAERTAIVDALESADGNKVHAARALGISRTTLYARMRALGI
ncbi:putative Fis family transcriptional regulator [Gordonia rhizosphera NBRC 16068]|uniref:Putative Fis family transcriptional regulator n=1 Tax=Gordonia rhizosphera NBRC 16068 TaxID=1108045 RepID=K6WYD0_9ACTN|nr:putative Fis family transcriptional regulator [Gordonia rhizosphera NBRC 16068]